MIDAIKHAYFMAPVSAHGFRARHAQTMCKQYTNLSLVANPAKQEIVTCPQCIEGLKRLLKTFHDIPEGNRTAEVLKTTKKIEAHLPLTER